MTDNQKTETRQKIKPEKSLYGLEASDSLQSVHFATTENTYLNEHYQEDPDDINEKED